MATEGGRYADDAETLEGGDKDPPKPIFVDFLDVPESVGRDPGQLTREGQRDAVNAVTACLDIVVKLREHGAASASKFIWFIWSTWFIWFIWSHRCTNGTGVVRVFMVSSCFPHYKSFLSFSLSFVSCFLPLLSPLFSPSGMFQIAALITDLFTTVLPMPKDPQAAIAADPDQGIGGCEWSLFIICCCLYMLRPVPAMSGSRESF